MAEASPKHESGGYKEPPKVIKDLVVGVGNPGLKLSPTGRWALVANQPELPSIAEVATPVVRLAGARWHAKTRLPDTLRWYLCAGMRLRPIVDQAGAPFPGSEDGRYDVPVSAGLPADAEFQYAQWRCDGAAIAMLVRSRCWGLEPSAQVKLTVPPKIEVWVVHFDEEAAVQRARRISALGSPAAAGKSSAGVSTMEHPHDASSTGSPRDGGAGAGAGGDHAIAECAVAVRVVAGRTVYGIRNWPISWLGATGRLLVRLAPAHQPKFPPEHPDVPLGPLVMESDGTASPSRTYQDLIKSPHDADLFAYYSTHCLYVFDVSHGPASRSLPANESVPSPDSPPGQLLGSAAGDLYTHVSLSPDATKVLVRALRRPFSYQVPARRFATLVRLWDVGQALVCSQPEHESGGQRERKSRSADGTKTTISSTIAIRKDVEICSLPAQESIPISFDARPCGPRNWMWHALEPATLVYTEALDGGDPSQNLTASELFRDALYTLSGPRYRLPRTAEQSSGDPARNPDKAMSSPSNAVAPPAHQPPHDQTCIFQTEHRISRVAWSATGACFVVDGWRKTRRRRLWIQHPTIGSPSAHAASPSAPTAQKKWHIIPDFDCQYEDRYASPGSFGMVTEAKDGTHRVQLAPDGRVVLFGQGASPRGDRPFLDLMDISVPGGDYTRERLWRCPAGPIGRDGCDGDEDCNVFGSSVSHRSTRTIATTEVDLRGLEDPRQEVGGVPVDDSARAAVYEKAVEIFDNGLLLTRRESKSSPPNYYLTRLPMAAAWDPTPGDQDSQTVYPIPVTQFPHPQPQLLGVAKTHLHYVREDGVLLDAQLYLPAGYDPTRDGPRPCLMWAYPAEFKSRKAAGQVRSSPYKFVRAHFARPLPWLLRGWVILERFACPVVAEGNHEPNDTFVEQICSSAAAAVKAVVDLGIADPDKIAVGGHSYGAFMAANLLAHSNLFRAAIARSGAYNRTLTPFGFQGEERNFWEAIETYTAMSPFTHATELARKKAPLLLIHGSMDENAGTHPMQSERLFKAVNGLGGIVKLVKLPCERHFYRSRESILHVLYEQDEWLRRHVEEGPAAGADADTPGAASPHSPALTPSPRSRSRIVATTALLCAGLLGLAARHTAQRQ